MRDIIKSSFRALFVAFFAMVGISLGLIFLFIVIAALAETKTSSSEISTKYSQEIVENAEGKRKKLSTDAPVILKLNIDGIIGLNDLDIDHVRRLLVESREGDLKDNRVKAIFLHINSPGGTVVDSDGIYRAVKSYKEKYKVPVYAYVEGLCASGGMYVACAADKIYSNPTSIVGSVGVIAPTFLNFSQTLDKLGIQSLTVSAGKDKDLLNPLRPWKPGEQESIQTIVDNFYKSFVDIVASNRPNISQEKLVKDYGANIFDPSEAKKIGFIDDSDATYESTLKDLLKHIGIEDDYYQVVQLKKETWINELFKEELPILKGKIIHQIKLNGSLDPKLEGQFLYLYCPQGSS